MQRRKFLKSLPLYISPFLIGCGIQRIDPWHYSIRSDKITDSQLERSIISKAKLGWTADGKIRVLWTQGTPYERGYQQGYLLRKEVQDNLGYLYDKAYGKLRFDELFDEVYERMRPFIPQTYVDEMHGLAHGARMPLRQIHAVHIFPSIGEWGGTGRIKNVIKQMRAGDFATTCSNFMLRRQATVDGKMYVVRVLDWGMHRVSRLHYYPLIHLSKPEHGHVSANIGWVGFLGAISGINDQSITLGEMGYGSPEGETLRGKPMIFLLRDILAQASSLSDVRQIIKKSAPTNSFVFLMSDGKTDKAELYLRDSKRFVVALPGKPLKDGKYDISAIPDTLYGGAYTDKMTSSIKTHFGKVDPQVIMREIIPAIAMKSNFQNVIYEPKGLRFWVNNAYSKKIGAQHQPFTYFDFGRALEEFPT